MLDHEVKSKKQPRRKAPRAKASPQPETSEWESHYDYVVKQIGFEKFSENPKEMPYLERVLQYAAGKARSLEFGSGKGGLSLAVKRAHADIEVTLLDFSKGAVAYSKALFQHYGLKGNFVSGSFLQLPFANDRFGIVHGNTVLEHVEDTQRAVQELVRVTEPGGYIVATVPNRARRYDGHDLFYTAMDLKYVSKTFFLKDLKALFEKEGCEIVEEFGATLLFIAPSYLILFGMQTGKKILRKLRPQPAASNAPSGDTSVTADSSDPLSGLRAIYRKWLHPLRWIDSSALKLQGRVNTLANYRLPLPASAYVTIGVVARKKKV